MQPTEAITVTATPPAATHRRGGFSLLLSELNPLQYLPVVGTLYRAVTGDTIPDTARLVGGLVVSGLLGGPLGLLTTVAQDVVQRVTGIDPDRIGRAVLADLGIGRHAAAPATITPFTAAQIAAYTAPGGLTDADALNGRELARLRGQLA